MTISSQATPLGCFLQNDFGDAYLYEVNHNSLNRTGARELHRQRFAKLIAAENNLFIIVGSDSGTLLSYLSSAEIGNGTRIVVVELAAVHEAIRMRLPQFFGPEAGDDRVLCITHEQFSPVLEKLEARKYVYLGNITLVQSLAAEDAFLPEYQQLHYQLQTELQQLSWNVHASLGSETFLEKQLENVGENIRSADVLRNSFSGATAVLLAGGPSLDEILPWVRQNRPRLVTIAVSRICRRLRQLDLEPDLIFSIDPNQVSFDISKDMLSFWRSSLFVHAYHVVPQLAAQWRGRNLYLGDRFPWKSDLNEKNIPYPGPTVSNVALGVAVEMGFSQIILAGVDLCFSPDGFTHARGSNESKAGPQLGKICSRVETYGGDYAESSSDFVTAIDILGTQAEKARKKGVQFINPAPGAAKVPHVDHIPLSSIPLAHCGIEAREHLRRLVPETTREERKAYYTRAIQELTRAHGQLLNIKKLAVKALQYNAGLFGRNGKKRDFSYKKRMDKIERRLNTRYADFAKLVKGYGIRHFLRLTRIDETADWDEREIETTAERYYTAYRKSAASLITLVQNSKKRLISRLAEEEEDVDIAALAGQWRHDSQPGRALVWLTRKSLTVDDLPRPAADELNILEREFQAILNDSETDHMKRSRQFADLAAVKGKARMFFRQKNIEALQRLVHSLENHPDNDAKDYLALAKGYLLEIGGDPAGALECYQQLFDSGNETLVEDGLRRVASLTIDAHDYPNALLALESLSAISPSYLLQYGEMLKLTGAHQQALNVFLNYLEKVPSDLVAMINLGRYYRRLHIEEGAQAMFSHVLAQDPDNSLAKKLLCEKATA